MNWIQEPEDDTDVFGKKFCQCYGAKCRGRCNIYSICPIYFGNNCKSLVICGLFFGED